MLDRGASVSEVFHPGQPGAQFQQGDDRLAGRGDSYGSFATFADPDGNSWLLQEVTTRLPGRVEPSEAVFASAADLESALKRAEAAHGEHEKRTGQPDANWPRWYAAYMIAERTGGELPR